MSTLRRAQRRLVRPCAHARAPVASRVRVGADLVAVADVERSLRVFGDRYLARVFTPREIEDARRATDAAPHFAARFAAKEAAFKVLGEPEAGIGWRAISVERTASGAPRLRLTGRAADVAKSLRLGSFSVSLAHEGSYAFAVVVAERTTSQSHHNRSRGSLRG
jgi:holo-[acyl-carrier protein] synthase